MDDHIFKLSDDPKDLEVAVNWVSNKRALVKKQREIRDRAKIRLQPLLEEAAKVKEQRLAKAAQ